MVAPVVEKGKEVVEEQREGEAKDGEKSTILRTRERREETKKVSKKEKKAKGKDRSKLHKKVNVEGTPGALAKITTRKSGCSHRFRHEIAH